MVSEHYTTAVTIQLNFINHKQTFIHYFDVLIDEFELYCVYCAVMRNVLLT